MGYVIFGKGYNRPGKKYSRTEKLFEDTWLRLNTPVALVREYKQDVRTVSMVCNYHYIDFAHPETGLAIELDGDDHLGRLADDALREWELNQFGWRVRRFTNDQVQQNPDRCVAMVLQEIQWAIQRRCHTDFNQYILSANFHPKAVGL